MSRCCAVPPAGASPLHPTPFSLSCQRERGKRKAPTRTAGLGPDRDGDASAHTAASPIVVRQRRGLEGARGTGRPWHRKPSPASSDEHSPNEPRTGFDAHWGFHHHRSVTMVLGGLVDRYPGRLVPSLSQSLEGWWQCEPRHRHHGPALGRLCALAPFFAPRFFGKTKKCGSGFGGEAPEGCIAQQPTARRPTVQQDSNEERAP